LAVTWPPPINKDFKKRTIGGSRSPLCYAKSDDFTKRPRLGERRRSAGGGSGAIIVRNVTTAAPLHRMVRRILGAVNNVTTGFALLTL
jgi:hypothetical protein